MDWNLVFLIDLLCPWLTSSWWQDDTNNKPIQSQSLSKDKDQDHPDKKFWLLCISSTEGEKQDLGAKTEDISNNNTGMDKRKNVR